MPHKNYEHRIDNLDIPLFKYDFLYFHMERNFLIINSPLDQFEIRNLISLDAPILGNLHLSITNIGLYLTIAFLLAFYFSIIATNYTRVVSNQWSIGQETLYATIHSIVVNQINNKIS